MNDREPTSRVCPFSSAPLAFRMLGAAAVVEEHLEGALGRVGLSLAKFKVLAKLAEVGEPLPLGGLADHCSCVRSNMTQLVDRLEADKLVERVNDPADRRSVRAALTAAGQARHAEGAEILAAAEREVFARFSEDDRNSLEDLVRRLTEAA
jgi:DNA-binding MarR family transcriptional regulator